MLPFQKIYRLNTRTILQTGFWAEGFKMFGGIW